MILIFFRCHPVSAVRTLHKIFPRDLCGVSGFCSYVVCILRVSAGICSVGEPLETIGALRIEISIGSCLIIVVVCIRIIRCIGGGLDTLKIVFLRCYMGGIFRGAVRLERGAEPAVAVRALLGSALRRLSLRF